VLFAFLRGKRIVLEPGNTQNTPKPNSMWPVKA
jgi:hypothetical protein